MFDRSNNITNYFSTLNIKYNIIDKRKSLNYIEVRGEEIKSISAEKNNVNYKDM